MEMTIDNSLELFEDNFTVINTHGHYTEEEEVQATEIAISTMRKYQKIEQIMNQATTPWETIQDTWLYKEIRKVIEDGKND